MFFSFPSSVYIIIIAMFVVLFLVFGFGVILCFSSVSFLFVFLILFLLCFVDVLFFPDFFPRFFVFVLSRRSDRSMT